MSKLEAMAREAVLELCTNNYNDDQVVDIAVRIARAFAAEACVQMSVLFDEMESGRPETEQFHRETYAKQIAEAIAAAEKG